MSKAQSISNALKSFRRDVPDYVGSGFVDMSTGMLLAVDTVANHPREILDIIGAATADLFEGRAVTQIETLWQRTRGTSPDKHYFNEIIVSSDNLVHFFRRSSTDQGLVGVVICTMDVRIGMLVAQARQVMQEFDAGL